jgi:hypothetical protein
MQLLCALDFGAVKLRGVALTACPGSPAVTHKIWSKLGGPFFCRSRLRNLFVLKCQFFGTYLIKVGEEASLVNDSDGLTAVSGLQTAAQSL